MAAQGTDTPKKRRIRLTDARGCRRELASLYSRLANGEVSCDQARAGAYVVRALLEAVRIDEIESRLAALESRL